MDVKDGQRAISEFLLLEGCVSEEIMTYLHTAYDSAAYFRVSVFRWISEARRGHEEL
jgi:hypothetical protein